MSRKWDLKLDKYGISKHRYRELNHFCLQYPEFLAERQQSNDYERISKLNNKIELIEQTAIEAAKELSPWLLKGVTKDIPYEKLEPPCGEGQYYKMRREFFTILSGRY